MNRSGVTISVAHVLDKNNKVLCGKQVVGGVRTSRQNIETETGWVSCPLCELAAECARIDAVSGWQQGTLL
ncbi:hypothetical protein BAAM1489_04930 [Bifidobacterium animalis subsp. animalis MCC 1489]|uniref:Uncharacterized protein n=1 Tax=Bifidobacterium animalis subsp. animalis IM386 TaxID=1402194 RepID=A0AAV2W180_9BIFI|nr:hypothetical protein [Bifidobacterium animalis]AFI62415.1 hypothetical protein BANAN_00950 [Bifidobacterium animalis subsp. animalis ATCC 25527]AYN23052.1 hypothetical protein CNCMI4602_0187 [Bifidobacterium animalis subsp. animalis]KOA63361.1 hypothetical protein BAAM1489_04930 [Bifidobacterium animalis subsp. animalis MCC 1489]CDI67236.1 Uncharacterized protein BANIM336_00545 [Bifidobacterium animalis subsp. animalis IM386]